MKQIILTIFLSLISFFLASYAEDYPAPFGLPAVPWPQDNPYSQEKAELGRLLFFDTRLSSNGTISCASCHASPKAYSDRQPVSEGILGRKGSRHAPTVINAAYQPFQFWDGRAHSLEEQCKGPLSNVNEMTLIDDASEAHLTCQERIRNIPGYKQKFEKAFGSDTCVIDDIAKAIATFERTILSGNSPFDRYKAGDKNALTREQIDGYKIFKNAGCAFCHKEPLFSDGQFYNIGIGMELPSPDLGRFVITQDEKDWGAFKVPSLRETANTFPYMHDGRFQTLEEVVDYYDKGTFRNANLHPSVQRPLKLTPYEKKALVAFLKSLSGEGWQHSQVPNEFPK